MNRYYYLILIVLLPFNVFSQLNQELVVYSQEINADSLKNNVEELQNFGSRYAFNPNRVEIANYLKNRLQEYGWDAKLDSFYMENFQYPYHSGIINTGWQYNVVADKKGIYNPDTFFVVGAHYDSYASYDTLTYFNNSPGADDNASSVAAILEIARMFQKYNIQPIKTLRIELYAAEELGLHGSNYAIQQSHYRYNEHIAAMMNLDMIGYNPDTINSDSVKLVYYDNSQEFTDFCKQTTLNYTSLIPNTTTEFQQNSDSWSYYSWGRKAIFLQESQMHPFYHTHNDLSTTLNYNYMKKITQLAFSIAYLASTTNQYYPISIKEIIFQPQFTLQLNTNPVKDKIQFTYTSTNSQDTRFQIINQMGKIEKEGKLSKHKVFSSQYSIPIPHLKQGIYLLKIENQVEKIIVVSPLS